MMDVSFFISRRLKFRGSIVVVCVAVSFFVMIVAVAVSSGFRNEIRHGVSAISGDIQLTPPDMNVLDSSRPVDSDAPYMDRVREIEGVKSVRPVVYKAGIVRKDGNIHGVLFKGMDALSDSVQLAVSVPRRLSETACIKEGDSMTTYFVGETIKVRQFNVVSVHDAMVETDDRLVVYAGMSDLQRLEGWAGNQASAIEIMMDHRHRNENDIFEATQEAGAIVNAWSSESESPVIAVSSLSKYPMLFDWLDLIDFNVLFILLLMTVVAGFNMISGLLIMLFENISTIGLLKALGMNDASISKVFLSSAASLVLKGMATGNALAFIFCMIQDKTHLLKLNPENYFVAFVPVKLDFGLILLSDAMSFAVIMLLLLVPTLFISKVDPAQTVRVK